MAFSRIRRSRMPDFLLRPGSKLFCRNQTARCERAEGVQQEATEVTLVNPSLQQMRDELRVAEEFLARYNRPGPRYTTLFRSTRTPVSLYMHIPFCESLCLFCA